MFERLIGNHDLKQKLERMLSSGRLPHSLILAGDEGVGKHQFAIELARSFVCKDVSGFEPCGSCSACVRAGHFEIPKPTDKNKDEFKKVFRSGHSDVLTVVNYKNFILADAIRDLEREANFRPFEAAARFFIVDDADRMNETAANALLKILEEPPSTSFIVLLTSRPDALLPTILSRCQMLRSAPVSIDEIQSYMIDEKAYTFDEARLAARLSQGSIGRAISIDVEQFRLRRERMLAVLTHSIETGDRAALFRISVEMNDAKNKDTFAESIDVLESLIHDIWSLRVSGNSDRVVNTDVAETLARLAGNASERDLPAWVAAIGRMRENFAVNINRKVAADALFISMAGGQPRRLEP